MEILVGRSLNETILEEYDCGEYNCGCNSQGNPATSCPSYNPAYDDCLMGA